VKHVIKQYFSHPTNAIWSELGCLPKMPDGYVMYVYKRNARRTLPQNKTYWMWLGNLAEETGEPKGKFHKWFGMMFIPEDVVINGIPIKDRRSTAELNRKEFSEYLEQIQAYVIGDMGLSKELVPWPNEMTYDQLAMAEHIGER